ncbi:MAG: hypothetical protein KTV77_04365 [Wolbachia endosymbiont of Fragariocoptes setiger]|nr:hypothetical protein [Wolbachia endosymbiont of Fragariocoptes setiger]
MPQLDLSTFSSQIFWLLVYFFLLFYVVKYLFLPRLEETIGTNNKRMINSFNVSFCLLKVTEDIMKKNDSILHQARVKAKKILDDTFIKIDQMKDDVQHQLEEEKKKADKFTKNEITKFALQHVSDLKQMSLNIALIYYYKLTNSIVSKELVERLVSQEFKKGILCLHH